MKLKIALLMAFLLLPSLAQAMSLTPSGTAKVYNLSEYMLWGAATGQGATTVVGAEVATAAAGGIAKKVIARASGALPYVGLAMTAYLTYSEIMTTVKAEPDRYPALKQAVDTAASGTTIINGEAYIVNSVTVQGNLQTGGDSGAGVFGGPPPLPVTEKWVDWTCYICGSGSNIWWHTYTKTTTYTFTDIKPKIMDGINGSGFDQTSYDAWADPAYRADIEKMWTDKLPATSLPAAVGDVTALKNSIIEKNQASYDAEVARASSHTAAASASTESITAKKNTTAKAFASSADATNAIKAAAASQAARDNVAAAERAAQTAALERISAQAAVAATDAAVQADQNNTNAQTLLDAQKLQLSQAEQAALDTNNNLAVANELLQQILASENAILAANKAAAEQQLRIEAAIAAVAAAAANPNNPDLQQAAIAAQTAAAIGAGGATQAASNAAASASNAATAAAQAEAQATQAAAEAAAQQAAEAQAAQQANANANAGTYDTSITPPDKKDITVLITNFLASSPLVAMVKSFKLETSDLVKSVSCGTVYGREVVFDFARYESTFSALGGVLLVIMHGYAVLVVVRGW